MLVDGVYHRDHKGIDFTHLVKPLIEREYEVDERMVHLLSVRTGRGSMESISEEEERDVGLKHFIRRNNNSNVLAPRSVIAIMGTKLSSGQDLVDDIRIAMRTLHISSRFQKCDDLVRENDHSRVSETAATVRACAASNYFVRCVQDDAYHWTSLQI